MTKSYPAINLHPAIKLYPAIFLLCSTQSFADVNAAAPSPALMLAKVIFVLGLIVGLILFSAWFARRSGLASFVNNENFKAVASLSLGQKEKVVLVKVGKQYHLLGVSSGSVNIIHTYAEGEDPLLDLKSTEKEKNVTKFSMDFSTQIKKLLTQGQGT